MKPCIEALLLHRDSWAWVSVSNVCHIFLTKRWHILLYRLRRRVGVYSLPWVCFQNLVYTHWMLRLRPKLRPTRPGHWYLIYKLILWKCASTIPPILACWFYPSTDNHCNIFGFQISLQTECHHQINDLTVQKCWILIKINYIMWQSQKRLYYQAKKVLLSRLCFQAS